MSLKADFDRDGVVVVRNVIKQDGLDLLLPAWAEFSTKGRTPGWNKVEVKGPFGTVLDSLPYYPSLTTLMQEVFGPDIALYNYRFVVKDKHSRDAVFLHQDTGYHVGWPTKASMFVCLSEMTEGSGGMVFWRGSHKWGYMGDAGELRLPPLIETIYAAWGPVLSPGDVVVMHSACWHSSLAHHADAPDRILADIIFQPANDPSGIELLAGQWQCEPQPWLRGDNLFVRSRSSRLKELQAQVDAK